MKILIIDDEENIRKTMCMYFESIGHKAESASNPSDALIRVSSSVYDLIFLDLRIGTSNGLELIPAIFDVSPISKIVIITAYATIDTAVEAMRRGATDYIAKPFTPEQLELVIKRVGKLMQMQRKIDVLSETLKALHPNISFDSSCPQMKKAIITAQQVALSDATVMLRGASGTGKTVFAKAIHSWSSRADKPIGVVSCPTLTAELLESELFGHVKGSFTGALKDTMGRISACEGGTLFLDEIGDLPLAIQPKLLRFIQDREFERVGSHDTLTADVRIIAATNIELEKAVEAGKFREDLYYRLNVIQVDIPSLNERAEDIIDIAQNMLAFFARQNHKNPITFTQNALIAIKQHTWKGNIRELRNVIERLAILATRDVIDVQDLPFGETIEPIKLGDSVSIETIVDEHIRRVINSTKSFQEAADILSIDQATLWRKRKKF